MENWSENANSNYSHERLRRSEMEGATGSLVSELVEDDWLCNAEFFDVDAFSFKTTFQRLVLLQNVIQLTLHSIDDVLLLHLHGGLQTHFLAFQSIHRFVHGIYLNARTNKHISPHVLSFMNGRLVAACLSSRAAAFFFPSPVAQPRREPCRND